MFHALSKRRRLSLAPSNRLVSGRKTYGSRRLSLETLEPRQMLSATELTFHVLNDATTNLSYQYASDGTPQGSTSLVAANAAPRGAASTVAVEKTWVIDVNRNVYVYDTSGGLLGSWSAGSLASKATPEGIATNGTDIWIVDSRSDKVFYYAGAASRLTGSQSAASSFSLNFSNANSKDIVTDGASLWVVDSSKKSDKVFKYTVTGSFVGSWTIDSANKTPTGITIDPANVGDIWISDSGTDRVYQYAAAANRNSGSQAAAVSFSLSAANANAQSIAVAPRPWAETPYELEWVRQFGTPGEDIARTTATDGAGHIYVSGRTDGPLAVPNPDGVVTPYLAQFDAAGNLNWLQQSAPIPGDDQEGVGVAGDSQGNAFQVIAQNGGGSPSLRKYDSAGTLLWTSELPIGEQIFRVAADEVGDAYMSSYAGNSIFLRKFDGQTGDVLWLRTLDTGGTTNSSSVALDGLGNIYVVGYTYGSLIGPNAGLADALVAKYTTDGDFVWSRQFGTAGQDYAFNLAADALGGVYVAGSVVDAQEDIFITKLNDAGDLQWTRRLGTSGQDAGALLSPDGVGGLYFAGTTWGALAGPQLGGADVVVGKLDAAGELRWFQQVGTPADDVGHALSADDLGNLYVGTRTIGDWGGPNAGGYDAVLIKLSPPAALGSGAFDDSLDAPASTMASTSRLVDTATSGTKSTANSSEPSTLSGNASVNGASPATRLELLLAREHVFESFTQERNYASAKATSALSSGSDDATQLVKSTGEDSAALDEALDAAFANVL